MIASLHFVRRVACLACFVAFTFSGTAQAQLRIRDICRVKGQEENSLHGIGLVVGLKGTGDADAAPTARALATMMKLMRNPVGTGTRGEDMLQELKNAKNCALVLVTATVPGTGARQGDKVNCEVNAIGAKSLDGGYLMLTPLVGPRPGNERVYAFAQGPLNLEDINRPATAKIHQGCRLEEDFFNEFTKDGKFTLVIDNDQAGFQTAQEIADLINTQSFYQTGKGSRGELAKAIDSVNVQVHIPPSTADDPVLFISQVLGQRILSPQSESRVVINQRAGTVIIGADVEIGAAAISHKNLVIETGTPGTPAGAFVGFDTAGANPKLKALVERLNAIRVPPGDIIEIIKALERDGKLYGKLIVE